MGGSDRRAIFPVVVGAILAATAVSLWLQFREPPASKPSGDGPAVPRGPTMRPAEPRIENTEPASRTPTPFQSSEVMGTVYEVTIARPSPRAPEAVPTPLNVRPWMAATSSLRGSCNAWSRSIRKSPDGRGCPAW